MAFGDPGVGQDLALYDKFLKEWYMAKWIDLLNNRTTTSKYMRKKKVPFRGRRMIIALRTGRTGAVQAVAVSGFPTSSGAAPTSFGASATPDPSFQGTDNALLRGQIIMAAIGIPQDVIDSSIGDRAAFYDVVDFEMQGARVDAATEEDRMCYSGGAPLATVLAGGTTTIPIVDNLTSTYKNKRIEVWTAAGSGTERAYGAAGDFVTVVTTERATRKVTLNDSVTLMVAGDKMFTAGSRNTDTNFEWLGFEQIIETSNLNLKTYEGNLFYLNRDRTSNDEWQSTVKDKAGGGLTFEDMQESIDEVADNSAGDINLIAMHRKLRRTYAKKAAFTDGNESLAANLRFNDNVRYEQGLVSQTEDLRGGGDWMKFDGRIPIIVDKFSTLDFDAGANGQGAIYFLDMRFWYDAVVTDWKFWAPEGRILREAQNNQFGVVAHFYKFGQKICTAPNTAAKLENVAA
jgi:hypothetical protein